jgi:hypothetical protein
MPTMIHITSGQYLESSGADPDPIHTFLDLLDPDLLVRGTDPDPDLL